MRGGRAENAAEGSLLAGRGHECAVLADRMRKARSGQAQCVVVRGPAGIGKSRLLIEAHRRELAHEFTVLHTRCREGETPSRYDMVRALLAPLELTPEDAADSPLLRGNAAWALPTLFPDRTPQARVEHYAALHGLYWLAVNLMATGPLALVVDDAHRCDESSLRWLDFLLRRADDLPLLLLLTYRPEEVEARTVLSGLLAQRSCTVVALKPLTDDQVGEVVAGVLAERPDSRFCRTCTWASGGNPLLLHRLLDELRRAGARPTAEDVHRVEEVGSDVVAASVLARLSHQPERVRPVARAMAVLGAGADTESVAALAGLTQRQVTEAHEALRRNNIVAASGMEFVHEVVRCAVLDDMPAQELERLRARAAWVLNDAGRPAVDVANHLVGLSELDEPWMVVVLRDAAAKSEKHGAPEASVRYLRRVLDVETSPSLRIRAQADLGRVLAQIDPHAALPIMREVLDQVDDESYVPLALQFAVTAFGTPSYPEAIWVLARALETLSLRGGPRPSAADRELCILVESMLLIVGVGEKPTFDLAKARVRTLDPPDGNTLAERRTLAVTSTVRALCCEPREQLVDLARLVLRFQEADADAWMHRCALLPLFLADEAEEVKAAFRRHLEMLKAEGAIWSYSHSLAMYARVLHRLGEVREAAADSQTAVDICEQAMWGESVAAQLTSWAAVLIEQAHVDKAEAVLDRINRPWFEDAILEWPFFQHARAQARWLRGDREAALDLLLRCGKSMEDTGVLNPVVVPWRTDAACLLAELGRRAEAAEIVERDGELAHRWGTARAIGVNLMARGTAAEGRRAVELLSEAVAILADSPARREEARAHYRLGAALLNIDDVRGARRHLRRAIDLATLCGSRALAGSARELAVAAGGRVGHTAVSPVDLLTGSEHRVATMAASGTTNREIAEALFVTLRTVETHLTNAYRKLRVRRRSELAAALAACHQRAG